MSPIFTATSLLLLLSALTNPVYSAPTFQCTSFEMPITVSNVTTVVPPFTYPFPDSYATVAFANAATMRDAPTITPNLTTFSGTFTISMKYCTPKNPTKKAHTVQLLTHGLGFDKTYWDFRLPSVSSSNLTAYNEYSYVASALAAGYSTLSWDRLGCGLSSVPDAYTVLQAPVELAVLIKITTALRNGKIAQVPKPRKVIHVGHSWGSELSNALAALTPGISDGLVLTGYSHEFNFETLFVATSAFVTAAENQPARFGSRSTGFITWSTQWNNQYAFLEYPYFDPAVLAYVESTKWPVTVGEFISQSALNYDAGTFTGPVLYLAAQADLIFCASNCVGLMGPDSPAVTTFSKSSSVEVYIQPNVGHGINLHKNATGAYGVIQNWAGRHGF